MSENSDDPITARGLQVFARWVRRRCRRAYVPVALLDDVYVRIENAELRRAIDSAIEIAEVEDKPLPRFSFIIDEGRDVWLSPEVEEPAAAET